MIRKITLRENYFFLFLLILFFAYGAYGLIKTPSKRSSSENRSLAQFNHFSIKTFLDGSFQDNFESALSDQFPRGEGVRVTYGEVINNLPTFGIHNLICQDRYVDLSISQKRATFNCEDYIVRIPRSTNNTVYNNIKKYNKMNSLNDVYYYIINSYASYDFEKNQDVGNYETIVRNNLKGNYTISSLNMRSYEDHKKYYYKTDHHWNYIGSYQGFLDIANMFGIHTPSKPIGTFTNDEYFFGSHARAIRNYSFKENFTIYLFDVPSHDTTINGKTKPYNHIEDFTNHNYKYDKNMNFYGYVYGGDYGEVVFDFHHEDKPNLLILSNSYSNAINELIAQYFNKTYVVDLRHYNDSIGTSFEYSKYIKNNNIDKTLVIADPGFLSEPESNQGLEL